MTKIRFELAPKPTKEEKAAQGKTGFVPVATRWIIERSMLGWSVVRAWSKTLRDH
jgi:hypothetical protein